MENKNQISLKINMLLNVVKNIMNIIFPLITFPYVSKVLGVESIGKYNFASSIVSYFILFAGLGISTYAIREGVQIRENPDKFSLYVNEIFTINCYSTLFSYILFIFLLILVPRLYYYTNILIILSLQIFFKTIGVEWIYSIYEDYLYNTIRSIIFQIISIALLFLFVRNNNDIILYAVITVFSSSGSYIFSCLHSRKYCRIKLVKHVNWKKHMKPILILFAMSVTVTVYVSSDTIILGFLCDDFTVGIYSVSTKVYSIIKTLLSSVLVVSVPRLSSMYGSNNLSGFSDTAEHIYKTLITFVVPAITGIIVLKEEIITIVSDKSYIRANSSLVILSIALFFCLGAWFWGQCILVPLKMENTVFYASVVSAITNIILNFLLIPIWKENAAAVTTVIAEAISFVWCFIKGKKYVEMPSIYKLFIKVLIGNISVIFISIVIHSLISYMYLRIVIIILLSIIFYILIEVLLENIVVCSIINSFKLKISKFIWRNIR